MTSRAGGRATAAGAAGLRPWSMVVGLGFVSLAIDMVSDGAISVSGALLEELGATALLVGAVTGSATAIALVLRLATGPWADRTGAYWTFTIVGYAMTAVSVPLLALTPMLGSASLAAASTLLVAERTGKAVRAPSKTVLLADAAGAVGRGRGFGVHKLLDQVGAFAGPLLVAAIAALTGSLWPAFLALAVPGAVAMVLLGWLRRRVPDPGVYRLDAAETDDVMSTARQPDPPVRPPSLAARLAGLAAIPAHVRTTFLLFATFAALTTFGLLSFGIVSYHLVAADLASLAGVPLVYAAGMAAAAVGALATGWAYDRLGSAVLFAVPALTAFVPGLVLGGALAAVLIGVGVWGLASGIQDSTVKALVADLVPAGQLGSAYGWFAVFQGVGALAGATIAGVLYAQLPVLVGLVTALQVAASVLLVVVLRRHRAERRAGAV